MAEFIEESNIGALFKLISAMMKEKKSKKQLFAIECEGTIMLNIYLKKIPEKKNTQIQNILLPNPIRSSKTTRICFFVKDLVKMDTDHDDTKNHYKEFFESRGITFISEIIPCHQLRKEYHEHEVKRRLCNSYDLFLMDGRLTAYMPELLGRAFWKTKKFPTKIRMDDKYVKHDIQKALDSTSLYVHGRGQTLATNVGFTTQTETQVKENVMAVAKHAANKLPGGWKNVRGISMKTPFSLSIPIYNSEESRDDVVLPKETKPDVLPVIDELATIGRDVSVYPNGDVKICPKRKHDDGDDTSDSEDYDDDSSDYEQYDDDDETDVKTVSDKNKAESEWIDKAKLVDVVENGKNQGPSLKRKVVKTNKHDLEKNDKPEIKSLPRNRKAGGKKRAVLKEKMKIERNVGEIRQGHED